MFCPNLKWVPPTFCSSLQGNRGALFALEPHPQILFPSWKRKISIFQRLFLRKIALLSFLEDLSTKSVDLKPLLFIICLSLYGKLRLTVHIYWKWINPSGMINIRDSAKSRTDGAAVIVILLLSNVPTHYYSYFSIPFLKQYTNIINY